MAKTVAAFPRLQIFYGAMWSGKTNSLIRTVDQMRLSGHKVLVVKPAIDTRSTTISARTGLSLKADIVAKDLTDIHIEDATAYAIDEAQFFADLVGFWRQIIHRPSCSLLVSGLDLDFARKPFGQVLDLSRAGLEEELCTMRIERMAALCNYNVHGGKTCSRPAYYSQRLGVSTQQIVVGDADTYQPACELHHSCDPVPAALWRAVTRRKHRGTQVEDVEGPTAMPVGSTTTAQGAPLAANAARRNSDAAGAHAKARGKHAAAATAMEGKENVGTGRTGTS